MPSLLYRVPTQNNTQYTLDSQISAGAATLTLNQSVAGVVRAPGVCVIDRIDSSGNKTASKREYKTFTGVSGAQLTGLSGGLAGSTDQVHAVGAIVEFVPDVLQENALYDVLTLEHDVYGLHASLPSVTTLRTGDLGVLSMASINTAKIGLHLNTSGASLSGMPLHPLWVIPGTPSAATTAVGKPMDMPKSGTIEWVSVVLRSPVSSASLVIDINRNFTSIFTDQNTRLGVLGGGTYASTASIGTKIFNEGDVFSVDVDAGGSMADLTVKFRAR